MRHLQGESRQQSTLFPECLDDYISEDNPVRIIDAFMDSLDMDELGFTQATTKDTGRKPYHPSDLLKLYIYGYLNQVRSTRRLDKECHRNIEVLWLMKRLTPDFKTIANFRQQLVLKISFTFMRAVDATNALYKINAPRRTSAGYQDIFTKRR